MFQIDLKNRKPIYEQVVDRFIRLVVSGELPSESRVPSVRELAKAIGVNPNTVQKAYRELENRKYIYTVLGQGSFVANLPESESKREIAALYNKLEQLIKELVFRGESKDDIVIFIERMGESSVMSGKITQELTV